MKFSIKDFSSNCDQIRVKKETLPQLRCGNLGVVNHVYIDVWPYAQKEFNG